MAYDKSLVAKLTKEIVDDLDADVRKMVSGSQADAHEYAMTMSRQSSDNFVRNINDEGSLHVMSQEEQDFLDSFGDPDDIIDAEYRELDSNSANTGVGFPNRAVSYSVGGSSNMGANHTGGSPLGSSPVEGSQKGMDTNFSGVDAVANSEVHMSRGSFQKPPTDEDMNRFRDLGKKFAKAKKQEADNVYYSGATSHEKANPSYEEVYRRFQDKSAKESMHRKAAQNKRNEERQRRAEQTMYKSCVLTDYNGAEKSYKVVRRNCKLTMDCFIPNDPMYNVAVLRRALTCEVLNLVGDWSRVKDIYIRSEQLIINGVQCIPVIPSQVRGSLPFDTAELIENGCFASIFNWNMLRHMKNLYVLDIDDEYLFRTTIADDLKLSRSIGVKSVLKFCPRLEHLLVNGVDLCAPDDSEEVVVAKRSLARGKHFDNLFDGLEFDLYGGTGAVRQWTANNFREYANSRGNKGLLRYCGGMLARGVVMGAGFVPDVVAHLGGGIIKGIKSFFSAATTPVE